MRKFFVSLVFVCQFMLIISPLALASSGGSGTGSGSSSTGTGSTTPNSSPALEARRSPPGCQEMLQGDTFIDNNVSADALASGSSDPIVLLSEGFTRGSDSVACNRAIYCLREYYGYQLTPEGAVIRSPQNVIDVLTLTHLKRNGKYAGCYISGENGLDLLNNYAKMVYRWIAGIVGSVCVLIIIVSGIQISLGGVSPDEVQGAKDRITRSLIGLAVLFLSALILYTINPLFFA